MKRLPALHRYAVKGHGLINGRIDQDCPAMRQLVLGAKMGLGNMEIAQGTGFTLCQVPNRRKLAGVSSKSIKNGTGNGNRNMFSKFVVRPIHIKLK